MGFVIRVENCSECPFHSDGMSYSICKEVTMLVKSPYAEDRRVPEQGIADFCQLNSEE